MDFDQLHTFLEIVRLKSFSKAAQTCYRTQPAISAQVRQLEQELRAELFERFGSRISLTTAGRIFAGYAEQILELRKRAQDAIAELETNPRGELVIAANEATCIYLLPRVFSVYKKLFPAVQLQLDRSYGSTGASVADLDSEAAFNKHTVDEIASLADLRKAPLVEEEYHGPLLLSADAATDTLHSLLASAVTATRPPLGTEARTNGPFASSFHARVLPDFMSAVDNPGLQTFDGKRLLGAYQVDDEGVPAQAVNLVDAGRLDNYLIGRQPVRDFPQSNGHGRAGITGPARPMIGVLRIAAENGLSNEELNQKLLALAKDRGISSAYFVETLGAALTPRLLYRISLDGKRTLVRGAVLDDIDDRALRSSIDAAGKDLWLSNDFGDPPVTLLAPALLFDDATVRRANEKNDKLPFYPPPE